MKYLTIILFVVTFCGNSQGDDSSRLTNNFEAFKANLTGAWIFNKQNNDILGTVYLFENWNNIGEVETTNNQKLLITELNYDTQSKSFVAKLSADSIYVFNDNDIIQVKINKKLFKRYSEGNEDSYFQVLATSNNIEILKKHEKILNKGMLDPLTQRTTPSKYVERSSYYVYNNQTLEKLNTSINNFVSIFGEKKEVIKKHIIKNKWSLRNEDSFQAILNYYTTL